MGREEGLDIDHPRKHIGQLDGFPLRLRSAHYALLENFPGRDPILYAESQRYSGRMLM